MMGNWVVVVWNKGSQHPFAEVYKTQKAAMAAYKRIVDPKNPHKLMQYALLAEIKMEAQNIGTK